MISDSFHVREFTVCITERHSRRAEEEEGFVLGSDPATGAGG